MTAKTPEGLGAENGRLRNCPESPNCVSTQTEKSDSHYIAPMPFINDSKEETLSAIEAYVQKMPRTSIVTKDGNYIHAQCTSLIFRFVDDLEIVFDEDAKVVHFRSASRVGHSDLGANRTRVEKLKAAVGG